jgi:hypothetical protein
MDEDDRDTILIDIATSEMTLGQVMAVIEEYRRNSAYSGYEIFLDGDRHAIVARRKE